MHAEVMVAGHICLDVIPSLGAPMSAIQPGRLVEVGAPLLATGGTVSNTGLALHKLGMPVRLAGKVGDDMFGRAILDILDRAGPGLSSGMLVKPGEGTSYTVVISPTGSDRIFLHSPGSNNTFEAADLTPESLSGLRLVHFGYPPLMRRMFEDEGEELVKVLQRIKAAGALTSLDMSLPDPDSPSGQAPWSRILGRALPLVDLFVPSAEELLFMLDRERYLGLVRKVGSAGVLDRLSTADLRAMAEQCLSLGARTVAIKAGHLGLYLRSGPNADPAWSERELMAPCLKIDVVGTTGSGDTTIAGFLFGFLSGMDPERSMIAATATGATCCEAPDATSGVRSWAEIEIRLAGGWERYVLDPGEPGWHLDSETQVWERIR